MNEWWERNKPTAIEWMIILSIIIVLSAIVFSAATMGTEKGRITGIRRGNIFQHYEYKQRNYYKLVPIKKPADWDYEQISGAERERFDEWKRQQGDE